MVVVDYQKKLMMIVCVSHEKVWRSLWGIIESSTSRYLNDELKLFPVMNGMSASVTHGRVIVCRLWCIRLRERVICLQKCSFIFLFRGLQYISRSSSPLSINISFIFWDELFQKLSSNIGTLNQASHKDREDHNSEGEFKTSSTKKCRLVRHLFDIERWGFVTRRSRLSSLCVSHPFLCQEVKKTAKTNSRDKRRQFLQFIKLSCLSVRSVKKTDEKFLRFTPFFLFTNSSQRWKHTRVTNTATKMKILSNRTRKFAVAVWWLLSILCEFFVCFRVFEVLLAQRQTDTAFMGITESSCLPVCREFSIGVCLSWRHRTWINETERMRRWGKTG